MARTIGSKKPASFAVNVGVTLAIAVIANGTYAALGLNHAPTERWPAFAPPGHTIGIIWVVLFAGMGAARWFAGNAGWRYATSDTRAIDVLIGLCLAYPPATHAIGGHAVELAGNGVTLLYALWLAIRLRTRSNTAALFISAVAAWVAFATVLVLTLVQLNGWAT